MFRKIVISVLLAVFSVLQMSCGWQMVTLANGVGVDLGAIQWRPATQEDLPMLKKDPVFSMLTPALLMRVTGDGNSARFEQVQKTFVSFFSVGTSANGPIAIFNINTSIIRNGLRAYFVDGWSRDDVMRIASVTGTLTHADMKQSAINGLAEFTMRTGIPTALVGSIADANIVFNVSEKGAGEAKNILGEAFATPQYRTTQGGLYYTDNTSKGVILYNWETTVTLNGFQQTDERIVLGAQLKAQLTKVTVHEATHISGMNHVSPDVDPDSMMTPDIISGYFFTQDPIATGVVSDKDGWKVVVHTTHDTIATPTDEAVRVAVEIGRELLAQ